MAHLPPAKPRRTHTLPPTTPLSQQVGGHAGVHVTEDESLLLKPTLPREIAFYQLIRDGVDDDSAGLHALRAWTPAFFGLLSLEGGQIDDGDQVVPADGAQGRSSPLKTPVQTLVLQNLLHGYRKPCILDVKLGTVLYDQDTSEEKKARMIKKAAESTTLQTGLRLTGFQVYSNGSADPIVYGKAYGYSLKAEQLQGLPGDILHTLLTSLHTSLADLRTCLSDAHVRIVGGSVLIIYEGDWERAVAACGRGGGPHLADRTDGDNDGGGDDGMSEIDSDMIEVEVDERGEIVMTSEPESDSDTSSDSSSNVDSQPRLYTVSLIDFAHARVVPGEGPDLGVLTGMDTLLGLIEQRKREVAVSIASGVDKLSK